MTNEGGINGTGEALVNTNAKDFIALREAIQTSFATQTSQQRRENSMLSIKFQMEAYIAEPQSERLEAGYFIKKFLDALRLKSKDLAQYIGMEKSNLSALLNGRRKINPSLAIILGRLFQVDPMLWLSIEVKNVLIREEQADHDRYNKYTLDDLISKVA